MSLLIVYSIVLAATLINFLYIEILLKKGLRLQFEIIRSGPQMALVFNRHWFIYVLLVIGVLIKVAIPTLFFYKLANLMDFWGIDILVLTVCGAFVYFKELLIFETYHFLNDRRAKMVQVEE